MSIVDTELYRPVGNALPAYLTDHWICMISGFYFWESEKIYPGESHVLLKSESVSGSDMSNSLWPHEL